MITFVLDEKGATQWAVSPATVRAGHMKHKNRDPEHAFRIRIQPGVQDLRNIKTGIHIQPVCYFCLSGPDRSEFVGSNQSLDAACNGVPAHAARSLVFIGQLQGVYICKWAFVCIPPVYVSPTHPRYAYMKMSVCVDISMSLYIHANVYIVMIVVLHDAGHKAMFNQNDVINICFWPQVHIKMML